MDEKPNSADPGRMDELVRTAKAVVDRATEVAAETQRLVAHCRQFREELKRSGDGKPDAD
jgi:hypothetical protein